MNQIVTTASSSLASVAPLPRNEQERLRALRRYGILDTAPEAGFDALTALASKLFDVPTALISLIDEERQWFKSRVGMDLCQTDRGDAFCAWALLEDDILEVLDPLEDTRFANNPLVTGSISVRYYAGAQLITPDGISLGTLCLMDTKHRPPLTLDQRQTLRTLAGAVMAEMNHHAGRLHAELALMAAQELELLTQERLGLLAERIKTPLTSVLGYSQLVHKLGTLHPDEGLSAAEAHKLVSYASSIQGAGQSLLELVNLGLEPMRMGNHHSTEEECDLHSILDEVHTLTSPLAEGRGMSVRLGLTTPLIVHADRVRLKRVLLALVSNALRHAGNGQIDLTARLHPTPQSAPTVRLSVCDQGPGLPPTATQFLLNPAHPSPLPPTLNDTNPARGGLYLVRALCHIMGVTLDVENTPNQGCRIHILLPTTAP